MISMIREAKNDYNEATDMVFQIGFFGSNAVYREFYNNGYKVSPRR